MPTETNISAGLAVFQNEKHYYFLAVHHESGGIGIYLERSSSQGRETIAAAHEAQAMKVMFRVLANDAKCAFEYAAGDGDWKTLVADADAKLLTTEVVGGFVGARVGLHARVDDGQRP